MLTMDDGLIGPGDPAARFVPQWSGVPLKQDITIGGLATHTSGLEDAEEGGRPHDRLAGWKGDFWRYPHGQADPFTLARDQAPVLDPPGTRERYSNPGMAMLAYCLTASRRGRPDPDLRSLLRHRLMEPIGVAADEWSIGYGGTTTMVDGLPLVACWGGAAFSPNAAARIARLLIHQGDWDERRILSPGVVAAATHWAGWPNHSGLGWWVNREAGGGRAWAGVPDDAVCGLGAGGEFLCYVPSLNLIVVRFGQRLDDDPDLFNEVMRYVTRPILAAVDLERPAPYPPSPVIRGVSWAPKASIRRAPGHGDNWPMAWGDDGAFYTAYGDGNGFAPFLPQKLSLGFARIRGGPEDFTTENIRSATGEQLGGGVRGRKGSGLTMVDGILYLWARNAGNAQLAWSGDHERTWTWSSWKLAPSFGCPSFLDFGSGHPPARQDFVYVYSPDSDNAYDAADHVVLARVPAGRIRDRSAYEFFSRIGPDGAPVWSRAIADRGPVFSNPGACVRPRVTYDAGLGRYLLTAIKGGDARYGGGFGVFDAPTPWGPWTTVFYTTAWDVGPGESNCFPANWLSPDGRTAWLVFSGDGQFSVRKAVFEAGPGP
jgi:hypothetical protein